MNCYLKIERFFVVDNFRRLVEKTTSELDRMVFVSAASDNHFAEMKKAMLVLRHHFPTKHMYFYDIGLSDVNIQEASSIYT